MSLGMFMPIDLRAEGFWDSDFPNGFGGAAQANNDAIASFANNGTKSNTLTQSTTSQKPTYKTNIINGHNVLRFDSANSQKLSIASSANNNYSGSMTFFSIASLSDVSGGKMLSSVDNGGGAGGWAFGASDDEVRFTTITQEDYVSGSSDYSVNVFIVSAINFIQSTSCKLYKNGSLLATGGASTMGSSGSAALNIGSTEYWAGDIQTFLWFWRSIADWEFALINQFLLNKIALT